MYVSVAQLVPSRLAQGGPISCGTVGAEHMWVGWTYFMWHRWFRADVGSVDLFHVAQLVQSRCGLCVSISCGTVGAGQIWAGEPVSCGTVGAGQIWAGWT